MADRTLMLVDGTYVLYRSYFGIKRLSTSDGRPTNAVYGFIKALQQTCGFLNPTHVAVLFDGGRPPERLELLPDYKGQRPPMPDDLRGQLPLVEEYLDAAGVAWAREDGCEADDLIASVAALAGDADVIVVTRDKDMFQLVGDGLSILCPGETTLMDTDAIVAKTGVPSDRIIDWLALMGDASDNIPGVPGVGPKTAAKLLAQFESVVGIYAHLEEIKSDRVRESLEGARDDVVRNVALVTLRKDLESPFTWEEMARRSPDVRKLLPFYEGLEFESLARDLREPELF